MWLPPTVRSKAEKMAEQKPKEKAWIEDPDGELHSKATWDYVRNFIKLAEEALAQFDMNIKSSYRT